MTGKLMEWGAILLFGLTLYVIVTGLAVAGLSKWESGGILLTGAALLLGLDHLRKKRREGKNR